MELSSLITKDKVVSVAYPDPDLDGFSVDVVYVSRDTLNSIRRRCTTASYSKATRQIEETLDEDLFLKAYITSVVKGWKGFKLTYLREFLPVEIPEAKDDEEAELELDFSEKNLVDLVKNSSVFDTWISTISSDLATFN